MTFPDIEALVTQIENYAAEQNPADSPCPRGLDLLRSCLAALKQLEQERDWERGLKDALLPYQERAVRAEAALKGQTELLRDVAASGVAFDDARLDYVEVQIDRDTWMRLSAPPPSTPEER